MKRVLALAALAVAVALSGPVIAETADWKAPFCHASSLGVSPQGGYVYARRDGALTFVPTDCLLSRAASCPVRSIGGDADFPRGAWFVDDRTLMASAVEADAQGRASADAVVTIHRLGVPTPAERIALKGDFAALGLVDLRLSPADLQNSDRLRAYMRRAAGRISRIPGNARSVYGRLSTDRSVQVFRADADHSVWYALDGQAERRLAENGSPFSERRANLTFKFDGRDAMALVSGGVVRISAERGLVSESAGRSRAVLIDGDADQAYYGYWSAEGLAAKGLDTSLAGAVSDLVAIDSGSPVTGLAVNAATGTALVSRAPYRTTQDVATARHWLRRGGRTVEIDCGGQAVAAHSVRRSGGIFVDHYEAPNARGAVLYLTGGPGQHAELGPGLVNDVAGLIAAGLSVDVVQFGGGDYTFDLSQRLFEGGIASIAQDARAIEAYVRREYGCDRRVSLYAFSFGGYFHRRFSDDFLACLNQVVLAAPGGSVDDPDRFLDGLGLAPDTRARTARFYGAARLQLWGKGVQAQEAAYFQGLSRCPLSRRTILVVGDRDRVVRPLEDYRSCLDDDRLEVVRHGGGHVSVLHPSARATAEARRRILDLFASSPLPVGAARSVE
ncbi:hypothetical protein [Caulobacter endophyticus]|uniref:hypothetical protein n=1 Tax=Caulobacter endophyticus TaxID=2172652 RepID=UPI002410B24C|nr:hypothetical protein [Caulobacter endophyticus]MDG2530681.1 hypothetical protein [Caulobacter endophyticus]